MPDGFAVTVKAYRNFLDENNLTKKLTALLESIDTKTLSNLPAVASQCRSLVKAAKLPSSLQQAVLKAYEQLGVTETGMAVAVRSSATAEDLPTASFAGQHESFLNVSGQENLLKSIQQCYCSLFNDRAIKYRIDHGFAHMDVGLSVGVQLMIRSDTASAGVIFTLDPESGFRDAIYITSARGLGESVVQGAVNPD